MEQQSYFLIVGLSLSFIVAYFSARHQKNEGHSFFQTFFFGVLGLAGLTFWLWQYIYY